jgi:predicted Fe-Mo cluster-binding NifX family protein
MSKVAFTTLLNREDSALSPHFGMAKWILVRDDDNGQITFEQNTALNGRAVVDIMARHGCTDAVFTQIGPGAFAHLEQAGIRGWIGPADMPVPQLLELLSRGELERAQAPESKPAAIPAAGETEVRGYGPGFRGKHWGRGHGCGQRQHGGSRRAGRP